MAEQIGLDKFFEQARLRYGTPQRTVQWWIAEGVFPAPQRDDRDARRKYYTDADEAFACLQCVLGLKRFVALGEVKLILKKRNKHISRLRDMLRELSEYLPSEKNNYKGWSVGSLNHEDLVKLFLKQIKEPKDIDKLSISRMAQGLKKEGE